MILIWFVSFKVKKKQKKNTQKVGVTIETDESIGKVIRKRSNHGKELENSSFSNFCVPQGISHEFSAPIMPRQNGIMERMNRTLQEMTKVMMLAKYIPLYFWVGALNTACQIHNRVTIIRKLL